MTYHITRYSCEMSEVDSGRHYMTLEAGGKWSFDREKALTFETRDAAIKQAKEYPGSFVEPR